MAAVPRGSPALRPAEGSCPASSGVPVCGWTLVERHTDGHALGVGRSPEVSVRTGSRLDTAGDPPRPCRRR